jgi:hypothetical protein
MDSKTNSDPIPEKLAADLQNKRICPTPSVKYFGQLADSHRSDSSATSSHSDTTASSSSELSGSSSEADEGALPPWDLEISALSKVPETRITKSNHVVDEVHPTGEPSKDVRSFSSMLAQLSKRCHHRAAWIVDHPDFELITNVLLIGNCIALGSIRPREPQSARNVMIQRLGMELASCCLA